MSGAIDLIPLQLFHSTSRGGCHSASTLGGVSSGSALSHKAAEPVYVKPTRSVFLIRQPSEAGSLSAMAPTLLLSVSLSLDYQCH